jgi:chromosome segregation ATPase
MPGFARTIVSLQSACSRLFLKGTSMVYAGRSMTEYADSEGMRARGEEALGELAEALLDNPIFNSALGTALGAGERAMAAQRSAMGALNVASGSDLERLEKRLRSLSGRLEAVEDRLDDVTDQLAALDQRHAREASERQ